MADQEGKYNIKAAALILGIQPGTLRAWERRYHMIAPVRNDAGHRLYTEEHIKILKWLIKKVNQGFTISQAISLMSNNQVQMDSEALNLKQGNSLNGLMDTLYDALIHFEHERINEVLNTMFSTFTMEKVVIDIFSQVLMKIEDSFICGKITNSQRNYSLSLIKARITTIIHSFPFNVHYNKAVFLTFSEKSDDFGQLLFHFYLRKRGVEVINIGAYYSQEDLTLTLDIIHPDLIIISLEEQKDLNKALSLIEMLTLNHQDLTIGLTSVSITTMKPTEREYFSPYIIGETINEWEMWLMERMVF
mgnify:CR=1 FL=1